MCIVEGRGQLAGYQQRLAGRWQALAQTLGEAATSHVLHDQVGRPVRCAGAVEHADDVGMLEPGGYARLSKEAILLLRRSGSGRSQDLDRPLYPHYLVDD